MKIIKLNAIDSTNDFLKNMTRNEVVENFTVVVTQNQTKGKGQMGSTWNSEIGKNLIMSILVKEILNEIDKIFHLNIAVSLAVIQVLEELKIPKVSIKWPNDIMSDNKKIAGILIENSFKSDNTIDSIVGIGLNVNQKEFSSLPKASSLSVITDSEFDLDIILDKILFQIKRNCALISSNQNAHLWKNYHDNLFKKGLPMAFEDVNKNQFMGIIQEVSVDGKLKLLLEDDSFKFYELKQIQMLY
ncbi:biotin--[acetyl-CoA-carboxylase] ligase [Flavobacterium sp.]|uniref:biotin--[acetyl-CoA-carboxylase] ligase n=1 Tax=Flavobacterium sp. TaxID=239 RepID=UPI0026257E5F|nr:biotin--[acetyl-CoA-carboxylase] ligase [Flavobacterium sp.]